MSMSNSSSSVACSSSGTSEWSDSESAPVTDTVVQPLTATTPSHPPTLPHQVFHVYSNILTLLSVQGTILSAVYYETLVHTECTINLGPTGPARPHTVEVATASIHPSCSQPSQVTATSSRALLSSVPPQPTTYQFSTVFMSAPSLTDTPQDTTSIQSQYPSPSSFNLSPPDTSPISPPGTVATPPDLQPHSRYESIVHHT